MSSDEPQIKYQEVSPFQISEGFTPTRSQKMEPVKTSRIFLAAVAANLSAFAVGTCLGWTSPIAPKLKSDDTSDSPLDHKIDSTDDAWISSIVALGALVVFLYRVLHPLWLAHWPIRLAVNGYYFPAQYSLLLLTSDDDGGEVWVLFSGPLIQGFGVGFVMTVQPMYVAGILYVYALALCILSGFTMVLYWVPIVFDVISSLVPESPYYYAGKDAKRSFKVVTILKRQSLETVQDEMATQ
ncbi:hypothetical protein DOY81_011960 [Sarcophaga bullata]|nr:hypothetical protein DOY81_011960 [Sarcophaga bullata]